MIILGSIVAAPIIDALILIGMPSEKSDPIEDGAEAAENVIEKWGYYDYNLKVAGEDAIDFIFDAIKEQDNDSMLSNFALTDRYDGISEEEVAQFLDTFPKGLETAEGSLETFYYGGDDEQL